MPDEAPMSMSGHTEWLHVPGKPPLAIPIGDIRIRRRLSPLGWVEVQAVVGSVNAADFHGCPAGRVLLAGLGEPEGPPVYHFLYRSVGWNTLFNPASGKWEPAVSVIGLTIYPEIDFARLP